MDIHRCRFVPYPPSTINVLAFSHSHISAKRAKLDTLRLAIGRGNGDIEIWNPINGTWAQEIVIRGGKDRSIDGLVWTQDPDEEDANNNVTPGKLRLFSIGYTTTVTEWDLQNGRPLRQSSGNHGEIWCLAAQPRYDPDNTSSSAASNGVKTSRQCLVTGCIDGAIVLYSTADDDLTLQRVLARPSSKKAKVLSAVFQNRNTVVVGCSNSTICIYDVANGTQIRTMSLGRGPTGGPKENIVWSLKCLSNGDIVSGDSAGEIRIWNGQTYSLTQRIQAHKQDILSLATSCDGSTIISGGMDRRTVFYKRTGSKNTEARWAVVSHKRFHRHDVKAMAAFEGRGLSVVVSGGPDATPIVMPLKEFGREYQRTLSFLPQQPAIQSAPAERLVMSWWDREVHIWRFYKASIGADDMDSALPNAKDDGRNKKLVARILLKGEANITSASISVAGKLLAVSTAVETKYFRLDAGKGDALKVSRLDCHSSLAAGARLIQFSPSGDWICVIKMDNTVALIRVVNKPLQLLPRIKKLHRLHRRLDKRQQLGGLGDYGRTINRIAFSSDGKILAVTDLAGYVDTWVLTGEEDVSDVPDDVLDDASSVSSIDSSMEETKTASFFGQAWIRNPSASLIPKLPSGAVVLSFRPDASSAKKQTQTGTARPHATRNNPNPHPHNLPTSEDRLLVVTTESEVFEFQVLRGGLSAWSRNNPTSRFPETFRAIRDQAMGCLWDVSDTRQRLWLYGTSWLFMFDLSQSLPVPNGTDASLHNSQQNSQALQRKRKRDNKDSQTLTELTTGTSGAGSKIQDSHLELGISRKFQVMTEPVSVSEDLKSSSGPGSDMDLEEAWFDTHDDTNQAGEDEDMGTSTLESFSRMQDTSHQTGDTRPHDKSTTSQPYWHTYKYRPIMGIVPIEAAGIGHAENSSMANDGLEVAIVERPIWEVDLPPRYYGDLEWEKRGV